MAYFQTMAFSDALYLAFPFRQINWTPDVFKGVGIFTSIFCPSNDGLKFDFKTTFTSILVRPTSRTNGITRKGKDISLVVRYLKIKIVIYTTHSSEWFRTQKIIFFASTRLLCMFVCVCVCVCARVPLHMHNISHAVIPGICNWNVTIYILQIAI